MTCRPFSIAVRKELCLVRRRSIDLRRCGFKLRAHDQLGPDALPVHWTQLLARYSASSDSFDLGAMLNGHPSRLPVADGGRRDSEAIRKRPATTDGASGSVKGMVYIVHASL